jgi:hypothetical protein
MNRLPHRMWIGIVLLGLANVFASPLGHAAPLPPPKKMSLPPTAEFCLKRAKLRMDEYLERFYAKPHERQLVPYAKYDYYYNCIECLRNHLDGGPRWKMDRPLTVEERRGLRDLLYRLERELKEGQANGTVGDEELHDVWHRIKNKKK